MIWDPQRGESERPSPEDMAEELGALCGQLLGGDGDKMREVVAAVDAVLDESAGTETPDSIVTLASRALLAIGEPRAARRLGLLEAGIIAPSEGWSITGDATMWVLDLARIVDRPAAPLELQVITRVDAVLDCMADVWDDADGRGVLGLRHVPEDGPAGGRLGGRQRWLREIRTACEARLNAIGGQRGWSGRPDVLTLD